MQIPFVTSRRARRAAPAVNPYLADIIRSFRRTMTVVFIFSFFLNLLALTVPIYLLQIYDKVIPNQNFDTLLFLTGIVVAAVVVLGALESLRRVILAKLGTRLDNRISDHLLNSSIHRAIYKNEASVNVLRDLTRLREFFSGSSMFPLLDAPWTPLFIAILYYLHPTLGLVALFGCIAMFALAIFNELATREGVKENSKQARNLMDNARAIVKNADVVQAMGMESKILENWKQSNNSTLLNTFKTGNITTHLLTLSKMLRLLLQVGIIFTAAYLILQDQLTAGATLASVLLFRRAIAPLEQSIRSWKSVLRARHAFQNISEYLNHAESLTPKTDMPAPTGKLIANNLSFRRKGEQKSLFSRVGMVLEPGKIAVLSGQTAAGKSTLLRILAGILPPSSGKVTLGGYQLNHWSSDQLGPAVGYLPQDVSLFPVSVRDNIARLQTHSIEDVISAAKLAKAHDTIQALPQGYDTVIDEDGANLSGGQRQRIGLARALFGNPIVILLDEPDANLDADGRSQLRKTLRELRNRDCALLVVSHHKSMINLADMHYEMQDRRLTLQLKKSRTDNPKGNEKYRSQSLLSVDTGAATSSIQKLRTIPSSGDRE